MEGLAPPLKLLLEIVRTIDNGESIRSGLISYLRQSDSDEFSKIVHQWFMYRDQGKSTVELLNALRSPYRRALLEILDSGLKGSSISKKLQTLEEEMLESCMDELDEYVQILPYKLLVPLLLFQFPAILILLMGPLLSHLIKQINHF